MKIKNILFSTSFMGSLPRSKQILQSFRDLKRGRISSEEFNNIIETETKTIIKFQEEIGLDIITSGELARDNYCSFVADKIDGVQLMSMSELLEHIEDKKAFEQILDTLDVPASSIKNAICIDKLKDTNDIAVSELRMIKKYTSKPIKITLPGPYLLTRSMWVPELSKNAYHSKEELGKDVVKILSNEIKRLQEIGVDIIQLDEPVLTEVVFSKGMPRSFMCAALSEKKDPKEELEFAMPLIKQVIESIDTTKSISSIHVCRGNWSKKEETLLAGPYTPLLDLFNEINPDLLTLEFSTPRAGELDSYLSDNRINKDTILGLGVVNPRTDEIESIEQIIERVEKALEKVSLDKIWLNPDCGFATFANRPVNVLEIIKAKGKNMVEAAKILRNKYEK